MWHSQKIDKLPTSVIYVQRLILLFLILSLSSVSMALKTNDKSNNSIDLNLHRSGIESVDCLQIYGVDVERYHCGFLRVPENYWRADSALIRVPFLVIFPDKDNFDVTLHPLLISGGGGPGNALLGNQYFQPDNSSFWMYEEFSVADGRVLILLENRGVGFSQPNLDCHYSSKIFQRSLWQELFDADKTCGSEYVSQGIDLSQYNVHNAALDIEVFRRLYTDRGVDTSQIHLYGVSYGTRVSMYYERLFPDSTSTLILDSVSLSDKDSSVYEMLYAQRSLDLVFSKCRVDSHCNELFGSGLESEFYDFMTKVDSLEVLLPVQWPGKQKPIELPLTATLVIDLLHSALYDSDSFATVPSIVSQLVDGSYDRLTADFNDYIASYSPEYYFSDTAFLTYLCSDMDYSDSNTDSANELKIFRYWDFEDGNTYMNKICSNYEISPITDLLQQSYISNTPTLFLSGELDPVTPQASAHKVAARYSYHWSIVRANVSHDVISHSSCARYLASWFLYHPQEDLARRMEECEAEDELQFLID